MPAKKQTAAATEIKTEFDAPATQFKFKVKKQVTRKVFKIDAGVDYYFHVDGAMYVGKEIKNPNARVDPTKVKEPTKIMHVTNLATKEVGQIIVPKVLREVLEEAYKDDAYVGKDFKIVKHKVEGKDYSVFTVDEIEVE